MTLEEKINEAFNKIRKEENPNYNTLNYLLCEAWGKGCVIESFGEKIRLRSVY